MIDTGFGVLTGLGDGFLILAGHPTGPLGRIGMLYDGSMAAPLDIRDLEVRFGAVEAVRPLAVDES
jgi:hypothetical protein